MGALVSLFTIVLSGGLVRLTGSGLGCSDWPACSKEKFIDVSTVHGAIEQINRLFTGVVSVMVIAAVLGAYRRSAPRRDLKMLSLGLVAGVFAQVLLGGVVVLTGLNPFANMGHFLLSMVLLLNALVLYRKSLDDDVSSEAYVEVPRALYATFGLFGVLAIVTGTVVTATGPHAGDEDAIRFGFAISSVARVHGVSVIILIFLCVSLLYVVRSNKTQRKRLEQKVAVVLGLGLLQGLIGYVQYFNGIPVFLVALHIAGAASVWLAVVDVFIAGGGLQLRRKSRASSLG